MIVNLDGFKGWKEVGLYLAPNNDSTMMPGSRKLDCIFLEFTATPVFHKVTLSLDNSKVMGALTGAHHHEAYVLRRVRGREFAAMQTSMAGLAQWEVDI